MSIALMMYCKYSDLYHARASPGGCYVTKFKRLTNLILLSGPERIGRLLAFIVVVVLVVMNFRVLACRVLLWRGEILSWSLSTEKAPLRHHYYKRNN